VGDKSIKGRGMLQRMGQSVPKEEMTGNEALGVMATGGWKGKPHSTKEGRIASGKRKVTRFFHGRKKKGVKV
jgi:hypothetical protein|tara:strand:+ start:358 stop:573 length:216 start_codon:yes stop_codon:yes gene_type:complete